MSQILLTELTIIKKQLDLIGTTFNIETYFGHDSTEGIVRTSVGIKHPKEEQMHVHVPAIKHKPEFEIKMSPITPFNVTIIGRTLGDIYGVTREFVLRKYIY